MTETDPGFTASMQEQLARRDHRIAVLDAIIAAQAFRITVLEAREGALGAQMPASARYAPGPDIDPRSLALSRAMAVTEMQIGHSRR